MAAGYIYVLANSSMADLVKIGKTTKQPNGRAQELSGATGVPTPFIVVYELAVCDCDQAEVFVHTLLDRKGYRVSNNREFFKAPIPEVIEAILSLPVEFRTVVDNKHLQNESIPNGILCLGDEEPWWELWWLAYKSFYGEGPVIQDYEEAYRLYRDAAKLGCILAFTALGNMHFYGDGMPKDVSKALAYYSNRSRPGEILWVN